MKTTIIYDGNFCRPGRPIGNDQPKSETWEKALGFFIRTDVGGSLTGLGVSADDGETRAFKSQMAPDVLGGVIDPVCLAADAYGLSFEQFFAKIKQFGHGTAIGLLTGNAARTAILTARGFGHTFAAKLIGSLSEGLLVVQDERGTHVTSAPAIRHLT